MLKRPNIDEHLWHIWRVVESYQMLRAAAINPIAYSGQKARKGRQAGPNAKHEKTKRVREVIREKAKEFWRRKAAYRNDASNTANSIAEEVNKELRVRKLLPKSKTGLAPKTIEHHIRAMIKG